jgi:anti-anti-sigma factor
MLQGRIDSMSSPEIQKRINDIILGGERRLVVNMEGVNYVSSAGLRVFLEAQKKLKRVDGNVIFYKIPESVLNVFTMSGFLNIFSVVSTREEIDSALQAEKAPPSVVTQEINGIAISSMSRPADPGSLLIAGSQEHLASARYSEQDVVSVQPEDFQFGTGLATLGERYEDYKNFFGEAIIMNRNYFFYPAIKQPAVDFLLSNQQEPELRYRLLHVFGFKGAYRHLLSFERASGTVELSSLVNALFSISDANILGIVFLAESKGLFGMNLKKVPIIDNKPPNGKDIFDPENFPDWMNFPVEPGDINNIVAGTGIAIREKGREQPEIQRLIGKENNFHIHGGIFSKEPLSRNINQFERELTRVLTELEVSKVQHLLGQTRLSSGMAGIIELKVC